MINMATETKKELEKDVNHWKIVSLVLIVVLCISLFLLLGSGTGSAASISSEEASDKAVDFINTNLVQPGSEATPVSTSEVGGLYNVTVSYMGNDIPVFVTKDGKYMFLASPLDITEDLPQAEETAEQPTEIPKTETPEVELYVMAFCPYGMQAETAMKPVADLLGSKANIKVRFIVNVQGDTPDTVSSLHGAPEAMEDLRQVCIMKYYDQTTFWNYVDGINTDCASLYNSGEAYETCWKGVAADNGIDASEIETCVESESVDLIKVDAQLASANGVSGSPTLLINGFRYSGSRTAEAYKQAICSAFETEPSECSQELGETTASTTGSC